VAKEKARHLFLQIDVSYIIVIFWEGAGMTKTHRKAHAAPPAAPARLRSTARPPGVATRVALVYVDETRCCSSMRRQWTSDLLPKFQLPHEDLKFDGELQLRVKGCDISAPDVKIEAFRTRCLRRLGCCARGKTAGGSDPLLVEELHPTPPCPAALRARGAITWLLRRREALAVPGALALLPRPMGVHGMQATSRTCSAPPRATALR
jgi:hypothetical protein